MRKMKDSGVAWLGEIPEDWTVVFNKHLRAFFARQDFLSYRSKEKGI